MNSNLNTKWNECLKIFRDNVSKNTFDTWFADIKPLKYENNTLTIQVKSNFVCEFIEGNFLDLLRSTLFKVMGHGTQLMYSILTDKENDISTEISYDSISKQGTGNSGNSTPTAMQEVVQELDSMLINRYTFDNYVEGISNRLSRSVGVSVADRPGRAFNPLFIHGASGVGKTHLVNAIGVKIKELHPELRVLYVSAHLFQVQYTDSILQKNFNDFMRFYQSIDVLIIDDIQEFAGLQKTQYAFFHIFNHLHLNGKQLTALYAITTASEAGIIDSANAQGLLKVAKTNLSIHDNAQLPVWVEEEAGFRFATVAPRQLAPTTSNGSATYTFYVSRKNTSAIFGKELADGAEDGDGLSVTIKMYYTDRNGQEQTLNFTPPAETLKKYAATWYDESQTLMGITMTVYGIDTISNVSFQTVYAYGTTKVVSDRISLNAE